MTTKPPAASETLSLQEKPHEADDLLIDAEADDVNAVPPSLW